MGDGIDLATLGDLNPDAALPGWSSLEGGCGCGCGCGGDCSCGGRCNRWVDVRGAAPPSLSPAYCDSDGPIHGGEPDPDDDSDDGGAQPPGDDSDDEDDDWRTALPGGSLEVDWPRADEEPPGDDDRDGIGTTPGDGDTPIGGITDLDRGDVANPDDPPSVVLPERPDDVGVHAVIGILGPLIVPEGITIAHRFTGFGSGPTIDIACDEAWSNAEAYALESFCMLNYGGCVYRHG